MPRIIASVEARMGSSRFPGKVLADIGGVPALTLLMRRLRRCRTLDGIILATSTAPADDALAAWAREAEVPIHRGSEDDVLQRVVQAQQKMASEVVVEVTADCVVLDPELIDQAVTTFLGHECDLVTNFQVRTFPLGMETQVFRLSDLEAVERTIAEPAVREHVSLYFYEHPELYRIINLYAPQRWTAPDYRLELDYQEDHRFLCELYRRLEPLYGDAFGLEEMMALLRNRPDLLDINRHCIERSAR